MFVATKCDILDKSSEIFFEPFLQILNCFPAVAVATKLDILKKTLGQFLDVCGNKNNQDIV